MTIETMRFLDSVFGSALCFVLGGAVKLRRLVSGRPRPHDRFEKILIIKLFGMGSITLATPTVASIRDKYPKARVDLATFSANRLLAESLGAFDRVWTLDPSGFPAFIGGVIVLIGRLRRERYDAVLDLEFFSYFAHLLAYASGARRRVGFISPLRWRGVLSTDGVFFNHYRHITQVFMTQAHILGCEGDPSRIARVRPPARALERARAAAAPLVLPAGGALIAVNVNASDMCLERRWPAASFAELTRRLMRRDEKRRFLFVGGPEDKLYVASVLSLFTADERSRLLDVSGLLNIVEFMGLLQSCALLISNDSGPVHVAQLVDAPTLSFAGPAPPSLFRPVGPKNRVLYAGVWCSPCLNYYTPVGPICEGNNICMKEITVDQAETAAEEHLARFDTPLPPLR